MNRHLFLRGLAGVGALGMLATRSQAADAGHEHHHPEAAAPVAAAPKRFAALVPSFQKCSEAVAACIAHCQELLAKGDKSVGECQRTALDCDVVCNATLRAALIHSSYTPALARTAVQAMEACVKACKPHIDHHAECKACHDACLAAIAAAKKWG